MREPPSAQSALRFCPGCGKPVDSGARFCSDCGVRVASEAQPPERAQPIPPAYAGLLVLVGFLSVGLILWALVVAPRRGPERLPLAQKESPPPSASQSSKGVLPENHPELEIPADVKKHIEEMEAKAAAQPKSLETWKVVAEVEYRAAQIDRTYLAKAEASFRHVLALDAKNLDALRGLGNVHFDREEYDKAVESYQSYLVVKPDDPSVRTDLGTMYLYRGEADKAIAEYGEVLAQDERFYQAHFNLGIAYAQKGDATKALASFAIARELAPDDGTRKQIDAMADRARRPSAAEEPQSFQQRTESALRGHPIVGPKIVAFRWPSATVGEVRLREFPMQGMPEMVRQKFLDRLKRELADAKQKSGAAGSARLDLVDDASGQLMATVSVE
jgi:tetratricopeptide (TPR) repeat protein/predicted nucleic acid-binding Zn ribbon protein